MAFIHLNLDSHWRIDRCYIICQFDPEAFNSLNMKMWQKFPTIPNSLIGKAYKQLTQMRVRSFSFVPIQSVQGNYKES